MELNHSEQNQVQKWAKHEHLSRMRESGCFRYLKEIVVHHTEDGTSDRLVGLLLSQGGIQSLLKAGRSEEELGINAIRVKFRELLGSSDRRWYWSYRVRIGVK